MYKLLTLIEMDPKKKSWKILFFVLLLNVIAISGAFYLKSIGIDLYAFKGSL